MPVRSMPGRPKPGEGQHRVIRGMDVVGFFDLPSARGDGLLSGIPFVPALYGHQAAAGMVALPPHWFYGRFFAAGIEGKGGKARLVPPPWNQPPNGLA